MNEPSTDDDRLLADWAALKSTTDRHNDLRANTFTKTLTIVRARKTRVAVLRSAFPVMVYVAGLGSGAFLATHADTPSNRVPRENAATVAATDSISAARVQDEQPWLLRQRVASASPEERILLLKRAGDAYLEKHGDVEQALCCYRQVLELTSPEDWSKADSTDSWLMTELKQSIRVQAGRS